MAAAFARKLESKSFCQSYHVTETEVLWRLESFFEELLAYDSCWFNYSTVTDFARFLGWSTSQPRRTAMWYASSCSGMIESKGESRSLDSGTEIT